MFNLKGSIVALVTPMNSDGTIDWQALKDLMIDLKNLNLLIEDFQVEKIIKKNMQMMKIMEDVHRGPQSLSRL